MARISQQTIDFIRKATISPHDALMLAGLHTLEGVTQDPVLMMQILRLPTPSNYQQWIQVFTSSRDSTRRFVWLWVLARLAELNVSWAVELNELSIPGSSIYRLPYNIGSLSNVQLLDVSQNNLNELPKSIRNMKHLRMLYIHDNEFSYIPDWIEEFTLDLLYAVGNPLQQIPRGIQAFAMDSILWTKLHQELTQLTDVRSMLFQGLPFPCDQRWLAKQTHLQRITFDDCYLWKIPSALEHCNQLEHLRVTGSEDFSLGDEVAFFPQLKTLMLEFGTMRNLPKGLGYCKGLKQVQMSYHEVTRIPSCLQRLRQLERLNFEGNTIHTIPQWFGRLRLLKSVSLRKNDLSTLPSQFGNLNNLEVLDLSDNLFHSLPECLFELTGLRKLNLVRNPISTGDIVKLQCALPDCDITFSVRDRAV